MTKKVFRGGLFPSQKHETKSYTLTLTEEQIKLIRTQHLRMDQLWLHPGVGVNVCIDGAVERIPMWECYFCAQGSFDGPQKIEHKPHCIIPLANTEWEKMNAEFIKAEEAAK